MSNTFSYHGATLAHSKTSSYTVQVIKSNGQKIGYAKPNQTIYVASGGTAKVYWFSKSSMPKSTNLLNVKNFTIYHAVSLGKHLSSTQ